MFTDKDYTLVYLPNFDIHLKFLEFAYETKTANKSTNVPKRSIPGYREIQVLNKNIKIGKFYIDERFNTITSKPSKSDIYNKTYHYLKNKYNELKKSDFRYGDWEKNGLSPTQIIFLEDFIDYLKDDIRDFKINILLNEEK
jgi:hypothetical protein